MRKILVAEPAESHRRRLVAELKEFLSRDLLEPEISEVVRMAALPGPLNNMRFDLILLSESFLIKKEGIATAVEYARSTKTNAHTPIVLLLARDRPNASFSALEGGADDSIILDPIETTTLRIKMSRWIEARVDPLGAWERRLSISERMVLERARVELEEKEFQTLKVAAAALSGTCKAAQDTTPIPYGFVVVSAPQIHCAHVNKKVMGFLVHLGGFDEAAIRHTLQVSTFAYGFGRYRSLSAEAQMALWAGGWFHDIGRVLMSPEILTIGGEFNEAQMREMRRHTRNGERLLLGQVPLCVSQVAGQHHERWDGSGYPAQLTGNSIAENAQLISIFDAFEAMVSDRSYRDREKFTADEAMIVLQQQEKFNPEHAEAFCEFMRKCYSGL